MVITSKCSCHAKIRSFLLNEDLKLWVIEYLHIYKFKLNVSGFVKFIDDEVIPALGIKEKTSISCLTTHEWLYMLGWEYKDHSKNIYFDNYKREDVVADRHQFLEQWVEL